MTFTFGLVIIITLFSYFFYKPIHKYRYILYILTAIIALVLHEDGNYISYGYTGLSFFIVVMYSGVLEKSTLRKRLFMVRAELAIIGTILIMPHGLGYLEYVLDDLDILRAPANFYFGLLALIVAVPLFVTSFQFIRRKIKYPIWKKIHQLAYLFYLFVGTHLILINNERQQVYLVVFGIYFVLKVIMKLQIYIKKSKKNSTKKVVG